MRLPLWFVLTWTPADLEAFVFETRISIPRVLRRVIEATSPRRVSSAAAKYSPEIPHKTEVRVFSFPSILGLLCPPPPGSDWKLGGLARYAC